MNIKEVGQTQEIIDKLIELSKDWESEHSCTGYRANEYSDIDGNRIFIATDDNENIIGYLFGKAFNSKKMTSVMPENTPCFEVEELYVIPSYCSKGIGSALSKSMA